MAILVMARVGVPRRGARSHRSRLRNRGVPRRAPPRLIDAGDLGTPVGCPRPRQWLAGFGRSLVIVLVLLMSVVGFPVGIWFLVRYQFMAQVVVTEHRTGKDALSRSAQLVRGRWWHTAILIGSFNLLLAGFGLVVGLLLLVVFAGIPLWLFSGLITLVYALIVPLAAVAMTLLFGDAVAEQQGIEIEPTDVAVKAGV